MSRNLSSVARQAVQAPQTAEVFLLIVEITHADLASPLRLVNNNESITSGGNVYQPLAFKFTPPVEEDGTIKNSKITIDNVDRQLVLALRSISTFPLVSISIIRAASPDTIEAGPWNFELRNANYNAHDITGELVPDNPLRFNASQVAYRNIEFPGLYG